MSRVMTLFCFCLLYMEDKESFARKVVNLLFLRSETGETMCKIKIFLNCKSFLCINVGYSNSKEETGFCHIKFSLSSVRDRDLLKAS